MSKKYKLTWPKPWPTAISTIVLAILMTSSCTTVPAQFHAAERECHYKRVGIEYSLECSSKGTVELRDGPNLLEVVQ